MSMRVNPPTASHATSAPKCKNINKNSPSISRSSNGPTMSPAPFRSSKRMRRMLTIDSSSASEQSDNDDDRLQLHNYTYAKQTPVNINAVPSPPQRVFGQSQRTVSLDSAINQGVQALPKPKPRTWAPEQQRHLRIVHTSLVNESNNNSNSNNIDNNVTNNTSFLSRFVGAMRGNTPTLNEAEDLLRFARLADSLATAAQAAVSNATDSNSTDSQKTQPNRQILSSHPIHQQPEPHPTILGAAADRPRAPPILPGTWASRNRITSVSHAHNMLSRIDTNIESFGETPSFNNFNGEGRTENTVAKKRKKNGTFDDFVDDVDENARMTQGVCRADLDNCLPNKRSHVTATPSTIKQRYQQAMQHTSQGRALIGSAPVKHCKRFPAPLTIASPRTVPLRLLRKAQRTGGQLDNLQLERTYASMVFDAMCVIESAAVRTDNERAQCINSGGRMSPFSSLSAISEGPLLENKSNSINNNTTFTQSRVTTQNQRNSNTNKKKHVYMSLKAIQAEILRANAPLAMLNPSFFKQALNHLQSRGLVRPHVTANGSQYLRLMGADELDKCSVNELLHKVGGGNGNIDGTSLINNGGRGGNNLRLVGVGEHVRVTLDCDLDVLKTKWKQVASLSF